MNQFYRSRRGSTAFGVLLIVVLFVLAGQNTFSDLFANFLVDLRPSCENARGVTAREAHQSLIARAVSQRRSPFRVELEIGAYPTTPEEALVVRIILTNTSMGTIPFLLSGGVAVNNPAIDGFGLLTTTAQVTAPASTNAPIPESNIRLLVPLQTCVQYLTLSVSDLQTFGINPGSVLRAYYRNGATGLIQTSNPGIFADHGLWTGVVESASEAVPITSSAN
ncbi:MAG: hypothetical protein J5J04_15520 [Anaerolineae bacterium]|nr:hypothetical protein [Anaerolineae bacterium]GIK29171.1 MAG: hypothetical protein BroJett007_23090 [Chloroflexota bacterium]